MAKPYSVAPDRAQGRWLALLISDLSDGCDLMLILGANAICDRSDILPEAIKNSKSLITSACRLIQTSCYLGILSKVIGLPGCARSPALNGVDLILDEFFARLPIDPQLSRRWERRFVERFPEGYFKVEQTLEGKKRFGAVVLGGGLSSRMNTNKLLSRWKDDQLVIDPVLRLLNEAEFDEKVFVGAKTSLKSVRGCRRLRFGIQPRIWFVELTKARA